MNGRRPKPAPQAQDDGSPPPSRPSSSPLEAVAFILAFVFAPLGFVLSLVAIFKFKKSGNPKWPNPLSPFISLVVSLIIMSLATLFIWSAIQGVGKERNDERRRRDIERVVEAIDNYKLAHGASPQSWSDLEGLIEGDLEYYRSGTASINPANVSGLNGNAAGVFPPGPKSPTRGNPEVFSHQTLVIWQQARCIPYEFGPDWLGMVVAGGPDQMALLYRIEVGPSPPSICLEV